MDFIAQKKDTQDVKSVDSRLFRFNILSGMRRTSFSDGDCGAFAALSAKRTFGDDSPGKKRRLPAKGQAAFFASCSSGRRDGGHRPSVSEKPFAQNGRSKQARDKQAGDVRQRNRASAPEAADLEQLPATQTRKAEQAPFRGLAAHD